MKTDAQAIAVVLIALIVCGAVNSIVNTMAELESRKIQTVTEKTEPGFMQGQTTITETRYKELQ